MMADSRLPAIVVNSSESSSLIPHRHHTPTFLHRYRSSHKCVTSKAALLILFWTFTVGLSYGLVFNPSNLVLAQVHVLYHDKTVYACSILAVYGGCAIVLCFYPFAGFLADNKLGRYRVMKISMYLLVVALVIITILLTVVPWTISHFIQLYRDYTMSWFIVALVLYIVAIVPLTVSFVGFNANVLPFGLDQLHDSPGDHQSLFVHWFVWVYYVSLFITQLVWNSRGNLISGRIVQYWRCFPLLVFIVSFILLVTSLCIASHKQHWFLINPARLNPYKLVYKVTKFAYKHKVPVRRSAFTFCEEEIPKGLDLGKNKYGGPFTTEQVEDVKVFYGILKVLLTLGPLFFLYYASDPLLYFYALHGSNYYFNVTITKFYNNQIFQQILLKYDLLYPLLIVVCIPTYLLVLRPFILHRIPGMLKRIGLGIMLTLLCLVCTFVMETFGHLKINTICMFDVNLVFGAYSNSTAWPPPFQNTNYLFLQRSLSALSYMLTSTAVYEFICSQSPNTMKGLLVGLLFAIQGIFQALSIVAVLPFILLRGSLFGSFPSCGMYYYLMNIIVGVFAVVVYTCVIRRYKYRQRDEPCLVRQYVEDYYYNIIEQRAHYSQQ